MMEMDETRLQQLQHLRREAEQLERQINHLERLRPEPQRIEQDSVQASSAEFPYTSYTLKIRGIGIGRRQGQGLAQGKTLHQFRRLLARFHDLLEQRFSGLEGHAEPLHQLPAER